MCLVGTVVASWPLGKFEPFYWNDKHLGKTHIINARKQSLRRLCFYTHISLSHSVHSGGGGGGGGGGIPVCLTGGIPACLAGLQVVYPSMHWGRPPAWRLLLWAVRMHCCYTIKSLAKNKCLQLCLNSTWVSGALTTHVYLVLLNERLICDTNHPLHIGGFPKCFHWILVT